MLLSAAKKQSQFSADSRNDAMNATDLFSRDYFQARQKFLHAARLAKAQVASYLHPHAKGPDGQDLFIDVALTGSKSASHAVLSISGTHGVEGYAGSAVQTGWLLSGEAQSVPIAQLFVHALNPFGFAWDRRVTEENVDLNRNFIDWSKAPPANEHYTMLRDAIAPADLKDETLDAASRTLRNYAKDHGAFAMQETISKGQYIHADGMYFGGQREQWSAIALRNIVREHLGNCRHAAILDFHTGLGPYGKSELISEDEVDSRPYARARDWWGAEVCSTRAGDSVSAQVYGSLDSAIPGILAGAETTTICVEYGTYPTLEVFQALRADNWLNTRANRNHPDYAGIKAGVRKAFYPEHDDWKEKVWALGKLVMSQALEGLKRS